jgi:hypothetical protein
VATVSWNARRPSFTVHPFDRRVIDPTCHREMPRASYWVSRV